VETHALSGGLPKPRVVVRPTPEFAPYVVVRVRTVFAVINAIIKIWE
jgi:hypothetical protein